MNTGKIAAPVLPRSPSGYDQSSEEQFRSILRLYFNRLANATPMVAYAEVLTTTASITLPTTPTVFAPAATFSGEGFAYDEATGVITFTLGTTYSITHLFNAEPSASNKSIYFYTEVDTGTGWTTARYTARELKLPNAVQTQLTVSADRFFAAGTKLRFVLWGDATVYLKTSDLPGTTPGTVTLPAYRFLIAG